MERVAATVLVVEDDPGVAHLQCRGLERAGYRAIAAATPAAAIEELARQTIDLIVLDYRLPGEMTGLDFYKELRDSGHDVPAIVVTGFSAEVTIIQALRAGVRDFVSKSSEYLEYLPHAVERVLQQVQLEHRLVESEARFQAFMNHSPAIALIKDEEGRILYANRLFEQTFQCTEWQGKKVWELWPEEAARRVREHDLEVLASDRPAEVVETLPLPDGKLRDWLSYKFPIRDASGRRLLGRVAVDITERRKAEESLRDSEAKFRSVSESAKDAIIAIDGYGTIISWNAGACNAFGYTAEEVLGHSIELLMPRRYRDGHRKGLERARSTGQLQLVGKAVELQGVRKDGSEFPFEVRLGSWQSDGETYFSGIIRDITERKQSEEALRNRDEQLRQSQKIEALGTLAGGVAHEFNNLLQAILGYSRCAMEGLAETDQRCQDLQQVVTAAERATGLTRQLLGFGRRQTLERSSVDPNRIVADTAKMLRPLIGAQIELVLDLEDPIEPVYADAGQLQQVLLNLCLNARDAMPSGGRLTLQTKNTRLPAANLSLSVRPPMTYDGLPRPSNQGSALEGRPTISPLGPPGVAIVVTDTGAGMSPEVRQRIFEPFFTTKEVGKGTGLGLAVAYSIVEQHNGLLDAESQLGQGSTFRVCLPTSRTVEDDPTSAADPPAEGGCELILLAEDEPLVRCLSERILQAAGYRTLTAADGQAALDLFNAHADQIALAVLDVMMPKMGGYDVMRAMRLVRPSMPICLCSGSRMESQNAESAGQEGLELVQKPFEPPTLLAAVRRALDQQLTVPDANTCGQSFNVPTPLELSAVVSHA